MSKCLGNSVKQSFCGDAFWCFGRQTKFSGYSLAATQEIKKYTEFEL